MTFMNVSENDFTLVFIANENFSLCMIIIMRHLTVYDSSSEIVELQGMNMKNERWKLYVED
ncbi:hypothetical protein MTR_4g102590 [Medicago truncatula]|uniref:Uncharacterized protein n=1 Tax=Medicago truncatula TaxID=3880 RepID=A0A072V0N3_MEDTR|nr:hypothetical protein MTR_4g102590 [Medicago truncatula]